jgi:Ca2+-binding RTX toxin-like protein
VQSAPAALTIADCPAGSNIIVGTAGNDVLNGTRRNDCVLGEGGDDAIYGASDTWMSSSPAYRTTTVARTATRNAAPPQA